MAEPQIPVKIRLLQDMVDWFETRLDQTLLVPIQREFPNTLIPKSIEDARRSTQSLAKMLQPLPEQIGLEQLAQQLDVTSSDSQRARFFKHVALVYRRHRAAQIERLTEKTVSLELTRTLEEDLSVLDSLVNQEWFQQIPPLAQPLPCPRDFFPMQSIESGTVNQVSLQDRKYDEKFHMLQAPDLFLPDLAHFRAKCQERGTPLAVAFVDIDDFKRFNSELTEPKVDRNLLPRFMQTLEAHVFHHGYAYRQGGDEYLVIVPSLSRPLAIAFFDELRSKLAELEYPDITGRTTVSIGLCIVDPDCPLTDRELRNRASQAKKYAKEQGKNRIATYKGPRFTADELYIAAPGAFVSTPAADTMVPPSHV